MDSDITLSSFQQTIATDIRDMSSKGGEKEGDVGIQVDVVKGVGEESNNAIVDIGYPEGGLRAWLAVFGGFLIQFVGFGFLNSFGVFQDFYVRVFLTKFTPSDIGWIGSTQAFLGFFLGIVTGRIFDRGYSKQLLIGSAVIYAISLFMLSLAHENAYYQVFLTHGIGIGIGTGLTYTPSLAISCHYFERKRPLAVGIVSSGAALGGIIQPIILNKLINGPIGFHTGVRISGAMNVSLFVIACLTMRTRLPPKEKQTFPITQWARDPAYGFLLVGGAFSSLGLFFPVFYLQLDAIIHGVKEPLAFYALSVLNAASFVGHTVPNALAPIFGTFNLGILFTIFADIVILCMIVMKGVAGTMLFATFFGLCSGGCISLTNAMLANSAKDPNEVGARIGIYFAVIGIFGLFGNPIWGALLTARFHWVHPIVFSGIMVLASGTFYALARYFFGKNKKSFWI